MIHYSCPSCQAVHSSVELMAGLTVFCKQCRHPIEVPKTSTAAPPIVEVKPAPPVIVAAVSRASVPAPVPPTGVESDAPARRKPLMRWLIALLVVTLMPLAYLAWRFFAS